MLRRDVHRSYHAWIGWRNPISRDSFVKFLGTLRSRKDPNTGSFFSKKKIQTLIDYLQEKTVENIESGVPTMKLGILPI